MKDTRSVESLIIHDTFTKDIGIERFSMNKGQGAVMKTFVVSYSTKEDPTIQTVYKGATSHEGAIRKALRGNIIKDEDTVSELLKSFPKKGLAASVRYLADYGIRVSARVVPDYEELSKNNLTYLKGNALKPQTDNKVIIPHVCNNEGVWGGGFVLAISELWSEPKDKYLRAYLSCTPGIRLGKCQAVEVTEDIIIYNMVAQDGFKKTKNKIPLSYDALRTSLFKLFKLAEKLDREVHMPKIGSDRAGGNWRIIEEMIYEILCENGIKVFVYEFEG